MAEKADYEKIMSPQTFQTLRNKSAEALKSFGKTGQQTTMEAIKLVEALMRQEAPYKSQLEQIAVDTLKKAYPIVERAEIEVHAELVHPSQMTIKPAGKERELGAGDFDMVANKFGLDKRRLINAITQGASMRESKIYQLFEDSLDDLDIRLVRNYNKLLDVSFGAHNDDAYTSMLKSMLRVSTAGAAGQSEGYYDEATGKLVIRAKALNFPLLIHELVKGLYEILSLHGFTGDADTNKKIAGKIDKPHNEPEDFQYGPHIYDSLKALVDQSEYKNVPGIRELFFKEIYAMDDYEFVEFMEDVINDRLTTQEKNWINRTLKYIHDENN